MTDIFLASFLPEYRREIVTVELLHSDDSSCWYMTTDRDGWTAVWRFHPSRSVARRTEVARALRGLPIPPAHRREELPQAVRRRLGF